MPSPGESMPDHDKLDDFVSNLNSIRDELAGSLGASPDDSLDEGKDDEGQRKEESSSQALEEYLASRLQQIGEVTAEKKEIKGLKTGNGWDANQLVEQVFKIEPISIKRAVEIAISSERKLKDRFSKLVTGNKETLHVGTPTIEYIPIWKIKGFHECYYIRTNSYRVNVKDDVVAVEVEGKSRDLIFERKHSRLIPGAIIERLQKLGSFLSNEAKYFVMKEALELATKRSEGEIVLTGTGRALSHDEDTALTSWRSKRIFDIEDLNIRSAKVNVHSSIPKEALLSQFRDHVVQMPDRFKQILSNRLQISELKRIYVPLIRVPFQEGLVPREVVINGTSGDIADEKLLGLIE